MKVWITLLRGINVGGRHSVPMKELVALMEADGFRDVRTCIQSGNLVYRFPRNPRDRIGRLIEDRFGFKPDSFHLSRADLDRALANNPFKAEQGGEVHFFFCDRTPESVDHDLLERYKAEAEAYRLIDDVFYLHAPQGIGRSELASRLGKALEGATLTARNLNTMHKLSRLAID